MPTIRAENLPRCRLFFGLLEFFRSEKNTLAHNLARLELDGCPGRNDHVFFRFVRIPAHTGFREPNFENSEVSELHVLSLGQGVRDVVECFLDNIKDLLLDNPGLLTDADNQISFREVCHKVEI